jgi:hypothetical protein
MRCCIASSTTSRLKDQRNPGSTVIKFVFEKGTRKWQFVWNQIKIYAPITDDEFFIKLASCEYIFA